MSRTLADDLATPILDRQNLRGGLTKREEFAKAAMQGMLSNSTTGQTAAAIASDSIIYADALIEALNKEV